MDILVAYVARVWFPKAAHEYIDSYPEEFEEGFVEDYLCEKVMATMFWPHVTHIITREAFEDAVRLAVGPEVWTDARTFALEMVDEMIEARNPLRRNGLRLSMFV